MKHKSDMQKITKELLHTITQSVVRGVHPEQIFLFGSRAWGVPDKDSDIDLFVIVKESSQPGYRRAREVYRCLRDVAVPIDVIVKTRLEVESSADVVSSLTKKVLEKGRLLYG